MKHRLVNDAVWALVVTCIRMMRYIYSFRWLL